MKTDTWKRHHLCAVPVFVSILLLAELEAQDTFTLSVAGPSSLYGSVSGTAAGVMVQRIRWYTLFRRNHSPRSTLTLLRFDFHRNSAGGRFEISQLREELELKDLRMGRVKPRRRPHYRGTERLRILELKAARGWSKAQAAERFLLRPPTIAEWTKRVDEDGEGALLQTPEPVNRFPDFVRHIVMRLKVLCPTMGKKRIAQTLARAGLQLGVSTVGRMLKERDKKRPEPAQSNGSQERETVAKKGKPVQANEPNHVWQVDLTLVPTTSGFWTA